MSRVDVERARREKLVIVSKRFWVFFVLGVIFIFIGVTLVATGNSVGQYGIRLAGLICGCYGIVLDVSSLLYLTVQKGRDLLPPWCFSPEDTEDSLQESDRRDPDEEGSVRLSNFERPPSYRTCLKMRDPESPPSYTEVILSISKTDANIQPTNEHTESTNENTDSTNENAQPTNENAQPTNENSQSTNDNAQSANENTQPTNQNTRPANDDDAHTVAESGQPINNSILPISENEHPLCP